MFYILALIFSVISRVLGDIENSVIYSIIASFTNGIAVAMMVSSLINCIMRLWARFVKNFYRDESYLTHTLPVNKKTLYASKFISSFITIFTTVLVILVCLFICYYSEANMETLKSMLELAASTYNTTVLNLSLLISIIFFMQAMFIVLIGYVGVIIGHKFSQNKIVMSIVIGFGFYTVTQIVSLLCIYLFGVFNPEIMNLINTTEMVNVDIIKSMMYAAIGLYAIYVIFYYLLGQKQFEKGVNVS